MREIKFDCSENYFDVPSYEELVDSFELEIVHACDIGSYQGDYYYLLHDGDRYGYLCFGYGSCSGCDALQACNNKQEVIELRDSLFSEIQWKDSKQEIIDWFKKRDWEGDYTWSDREHRQFVRECVAKLEEI